jgi:alpha-L-fucosidase 2
MKDIGVSKISLDRPASEWLEALPLGNGALGAMCHGGVRSVRFDLNDETGWSGNPSSESGQHPGSDHSLAGLIAESRRLIAEGRWAEAGEPLLRLQSPYAQSYLPFAALELDLEDAPTDPREYRRSLDLRGGIHTVSYQPSHEDASPVEGGAPVSHRTLISVRRGVLLHVVDGLPEGAPIGLELTTPLRELARSGDAERSVLLVRLPSDVAPGHEPQFPAVTWSEAPGDAVEGAVVARIVRESGPEGGPRIAVYLATDTSFRHVGRPLEGTAEDALARADARIEEAVALGAEALLGEHVADHRAVFERVQLTLEGGDDRSGIPADQRVRLLASDERGPASDPALIALLFDYGRYLLMSSSRPGGLPANLQGIWNDKMQPPWSSSYTTNINLQMNYWQAEVANLAETAEPLVDFIEALAVAGETTARRVYGLDGWVNHHNADAWLYTSPVGAGHGDPSWSFWPMGGPWLVRHLWEHARFGAAGQDFLRERAWPVMRSASQFALGWMVRLESGEWGTSPSSSPENVFIAPDGSTGSVAQSSAMDIRLLRDLFAMVIETADAIGLADDVVAVSARERLAELPSGLAIGSAGQLLEWDREFEEADIHHRHVSPLYGLYPGDGFSEQEHRDAAEVFLDRRGDDSTGWSLVWKMALWARLGRGDRVSGLLRLFFRPAGSVEGQWAGGLYPNLFAAHPPFQLDGNLGFVAALAEALVQSHDDVVELLPALPADDLPVGRVSGLVARPGLLIDIAWRDGSLVSATVEGRSADVSGTFRLRYRGAVIERTIATGERLELDAADFA